MPNTARWAATLTLTATAVLAPLAGSAHAAPEAAGTGLYAPSALVLTVGHGESALTVTPERAVTLSCGPTVSGTHPAPAAACAELGLAGGDPSALAVESDRACTRQYDPVTVTLDGVWQGKRISYERTFSNECVKDSYDSVLFSF